MEDVLKCWAHWRNECVCEYAEACRLCTETEPAMNRQLGGQDFDSVSEWAPDLADYGHTPGDDPMPEPDAPEHSGGDLAGFLNFLLHLDDYTLGILAEIIAPSQPGCSRLSVSDIARIHGISRQGMHRKLIDTARKSPELCSLLLLTVKKIRKAKREFDHPCRREFIRSTDQPELPYHV